MHYEYQIILKRWLPILKEYERTRSKVTPLTFQVRKRPLQGSSHQRKRTEAVLCQMDSRWQENESLLPSKRGAKPGQDAHPKR